MTSTPVTDVKALFMNVTSTRANADKPADAFSRVMNDTAGKSGVRDQQDAGTVTEQTQKAKKTTVVDNSSKKVSKEDTTIAERINSKADTSEQAEEITGEIMDAADKVKEAIMDKLGISEEELVSVMETLGLQMADLLNPDNVMNLMTELTGSVDTLSLLTDEALYADVKEIMQLSEDLAASIKEQFALTDEQFAEILAANKEQMTATPEEQVMPEENPVKSEENPIRVEVEVTKVDTEAPTEQTADSEPETKGFATLKSEEAQQDHQENSRQESGNEFLGGNTTVQTNVNSVGDVVETVKEFRMVDGAEILKQVSDYIKVNVGPEISSVEMQLHPASLGTLNIHLTSQNGVVSAQIIVQSEAVKAALETQVLQLKENMNEQNLKVEAVEVTVANHDMDRNFGDAAHDDAEQGGSDRRSRRQINLNDLQDFPDDLSDEEQLTAEMMDINGNSVDFTA
ncbi:MAG TPA: flagellar hook-length control protein FliK [Lachnospiraceae bacterium]|nr:flagellar hook-length control protein FliK [Lachnospiraceae bacterium]